MMDALALQRLAHHFHVGGFRRVARVMTRLGRHLFACHLPPEAVIGERCELGYGGIGIVVHPEARIGKDVLISPGVVIGGRSGLAGAPIIGDRVKIGAGAKVLGPITIGEGAQVGANAVVLHDVEPGSVVVGVPAAPINHKLRVIDGIA